MSIMLKFLFSLIIIFSFSIISVAQKVETDEPSDVIVPEQAMKQVVQRVLVWSFKPRNKPKIIYLAEQGVQKSWLPSIKNIEFRLLSVEDINQRKISIYFFTNSERKGNEFGIGFVFGEPNCNYFGGFWHFRISKQRIKLWQNGGIGGGCSS